MKKLFKGLSKAASFSSKAKGDKAEKDALKRTASSVPHSATQDSEVPVAAPETSAAKSGKKTGKPPTGKKGALAATTAELKPEEMMEQKDTEEESGKPVTAPDHEDEIAPQENKEASMAPEKTSKILEGLRAKNEDELETELEAAMEENFKLKLENTLLMEMLAASRLDEGRLDKDLKKRQAELLKLKH